MSSIASKVAVPMILVGIFVTTIFISLNYQSLNLIFYIILFLLSVFVFFFGFATGQSLAGPVKKLLQRAIDLSKGDLKTRVYLDEGKDEVSQLAKIFNNIADELEKSKSETQESEKSVDIKVRAKTQGLEETITALEQKIKNRTLELQKIAADSKKMQEKAQEKEIEAEDLKRQINSLRTSLGRARPKAGKKTNDAG